MMNYQWLLISIVLSAVQINAATYPRQAPTQQCPNISLCDYIDCTNGQCVDDKTANGCFKCMCSVGFTGQYCNTPIATTTACDPVCLNNGQCQQTGAGNYTCVCTSDYTGNQCETSILATHACVTMPGTVCQNGATCTINGADYLCSCSMGWTGTNCETPDAITTCNPNPCGAHGTCQQAVLPTNALAVLCVCEAQWTGQYCDVNVADNCTVDFCQSGGTCQMNGNTPYCLCPPTYTGQQCEIPISVLSTTTPIAPMTTSTGIFTTTSISTGGPSSCSSSPCLNGGTCYNTGNGFVCLCTPQYSGLTCSIQNSATTPFTTTASGIDACSSNPCSNGGTCYKYGGSFVCVCRAPYAGSTCSMAQSTTVPVITTSNSAITCANQPCQNGATCYSTSTSYFCYCGANSMYGGKNCDTPNVAADPSCTLDCSPGYCVAAGGSQNAYACMCDGTLTQTSCSSK
jgi:hypothetical protein